MQDEKTIQHENVANRTMHSWYPQSSFPNEACTIYNRTEWLINFKCVRVS